MKKIFILSVFALILPSYSYAYYNPYFRQEYIESEFDRKDSITFSSAYFENSYTNKQLANFNLEVIRGLERLEDFVVNKFDNKRRIKWETRALYSIFICNALYVAYHEIGHGLRTKAYGNDFRLRVGKPHANNNAKDTSFTPDENFFQFFIKKCFNFSGFSYCSYRITKPFSKIAELIVTSGGINNETYLTERIGLDFWDRGRLGFAGSFAYFLGKLSPIVYVLTTNILFKDGSGDPDKIANDYKTLGISATKNDIVLSELLSLCLSGTTWSIIKSMFSSGKYATPISFYNFQIPDIFSYITSKGISYRLVSAYNCFDNLKFLFGAEHVLHGKSTTEFHLGTNISFSDSYLKLMTTLGNGFNFEAVYSIPVINNHLSINVEAGTYSYKSLLGERHAKNLREKNERCNDIAVSISYKY